MPSPEMRLNAQFDPLEPLLQINPHEMGRIAHSWARGENDCPFDEASDPIAYWSWIAGLRYEFYAEQFLVQQDYCRGELELYDRTVDDLANAGIARIHLDHAVRKASQTLPSIEEVAKVISCEVSEWAGNCFGISCMIYRAGLFPGFRPVYGEYHGHIDPRGYFSGSMPFSQHGWLQNDKGVVIDPTRYAFTAETPHIHIGPHDYDYDIAGERRRASRSGFCMPPHRSVAAVPACTERAYPLALSEALCDILQRRMPDCRKSNSGLILTQAEAFWLANQPFGRLEGHHLELIAALEEAGLKALIPTDTYALTHPDRFEKAYVFAEEMRAA